VTRTSGRRHIDGILDRLCASLIASGCGGDSMRKSCAKALNYTQSMTAEEFEQFRHKAVHSLMDLNEDCEHRFGIGHWEHWDYDLDAGTLVFSDGGVPRVVANIQAVGTTSTASKTWLWGWADDRFPAGVTAGLREVREFGTQENLPQLRNQPSPTMSIWVGIWQQLPPR
jgi:hypothetical protein